MRKLGETETELSSSRHPHILPCHHAGTKPRPGAQFPLDMRGSSIRRNTTQAHLPPSFARSTGHTPLPDPVTTLPFCPGKSEFSLRSAKNQRWIIFLLCNRFHKQLQRELWIVDDTNNETKKCKTEMREGRTIICTV